MAALGTVKGDVAVRHGAKLWNNAAPTRQAIIIHTTEGGYEGAIGWMEGQRNGSYHRLVSLDGRETWLVPEDKQSWSAMATGNRIGLHLSHEGYARFTRAEWLAKGASLERAAQRIAAWHKAYGIPLVRISAADLKAGKRGIAGHADVSTAWRETNHTDPGGGYPYDVVIARAKEIVAGPTSGGNTMADEYAKDARAQLTGSTQLGKYPGWAQLGGRTLVDAVAAIGAKLGIPGFYDPQEKK